MAVMNGTLGLYQGPKTLMKVIGWLAEGYSEDDLLQIGVARPSVWPVEYLVCLFGVECFVFGAVVEYAVAEVYEQQVAFFIGFVDFVAAFHCLLDFFLDDEVVDLARLLGAQLLATPRGEEQEQRE